MSLLLSEAREGGRLKPRACTCIVRKGERNDDIIRAVVDLLSPLARSPAAVLSVHHRPPRPASSPHRRSRLQRPIMSEIRRKLVIVGDGACGKVRRSPSLFASLPFAIVSFRADISSPPPLYSPPN